MRHSLVAAIAALCLLFAVAPAANANLGTGLAAYRAGNFDEAVKELEPLANSGVLEAQFVLGQMSLKGEGMPQSFEGAAAWFEKAASKGHAASQMSLAALYSLGLAKERNFALAYFWTIMSVVWTDTALREAAMYSLSEVSKRLTEDQKLGIAGPGLNAWRGQGPAVPPIIE